MLLLLSYMKARWKILLSKKRYIHGSLENVFFIETLEVRDRKPTLIHGRYRHYDYIDIDTLCS